jgi:hypothetical protein
VVPLPWYTPPWLTHAMAPNVSQVPSGEQQAPVSAHGFGSHVVQFSL